MTPSRTTLWSVVAALAFPAAVLAQNPPAAKPAKETQAQLMHEARISLATATATARKEVPTGKITEHELEREKGKLIWSFDITIAGKPGTEEVNVDAVTGAMVAHTHESPESEAKEAKADAHKPGSQR